MNEPPEAPEDARPAALTVPAQPTEPAQPTVPAQPTGQPEPAPPVQETVILSATPQAAEQEATVLAEVTALVTLEATADTTEPSEPSRGSEGSEPSEPSELEPGPAEGGAAAPAGLLSAATSELDLKPALEAVLMVVDEPATEDHLAKVLDRPRRAVAKALRELSDDYTREGRGFDLRLVAGGWRFYTRPEYAPAVEKFVLDGQQARLTQAALETLAVVAYRQPVSRSRVSAVRGVNCDGVMRTLLQRGLVEEGGTEPETGAILYRTTNYFLERMGLRSLDELPELAPFLPEADAVEAESQEGLPSFDPDAPDDTPSGPMTTSMMET